MRAAYCTWWQCTSTPTHAQVDEVGGIWAMLCAKHDRELAQALVHVDQTLAAKAINSALGRKP